MRNLFVLPLTFSAVVMSGCQTARIVSEETMRSAARPVVCNTKTACEKMWKKAQFWVTNNAGYKVQTATDLVLQTYNATKYSMTWSMQLTREPSTDEVERIWLRLDCGPVPACAENSAEVAARFKSYMLD